MEKLISEIADIIEHVDDVDEAARLSLVAFLDGIREVGPVVVEQELQPYALHIWDKTIDALKAQITEKGNE